MSETITFRVGETGVTVDRFPEEIEVTDLFLRDVDRALARFEGDRLMITAANGEATYLLTGDDPQRGTRRCSRLYASLLPT